MRSGLTILIGGFVLACGVAAVGDPPESELIRRVDPIEYRVQWMASSNGGAESINGYADELKSKEYSLAGMRAGQ